MRNGNLQAFLSAAAGFIALLFILPHPSLAATPTTLDISAPSSVEMDDTFTVSAYYMNMSNGTGICGATCAISGDWFSGIMDEQPSCYYSYDVTAPSFTGARTITVRCEKTDYDMKEVYANVNFEEKASSVSVSVAPAVQYAGMPVNVEASYVDDSEKVIYGADCKAFRRSGSKTRLTAH
ncbi:MAG: hypothetical protein V1813_02005, partial [Candidatus Aenigmatarchaeota archaeon]